MDENGTMMPLAKEIWAKDMRVATISTVKKPDSQPDTPTAKLQPSLGGKVEAAQAEVGKKQEGALDEVQMEVWAKQRLPLRMKRLGAMQRSRDTRLARKSVDASGEGQVRHERKVEDEVEGRGGQ